jgi:hypothetical protein
MEAVSSSEKTVDFHRTTRRYIPEDITFHLFVILSAFVTKTLKDSTTRFPHLSVRLFVRMKKLQNLWRDFDEICGSLLKFCQHIQILVRIYKNKNILHKVARRA